ILYGLSLDRTGKYAEVQRLTALLKEMKEVKQDPLLSAAVYERLGRFDVNFSWLDRVTYFEKLWTTLSKDSTSWNLVCGWLGQALLRTTSADRALAVLSQAVPTENKVDQWWVQFIRSQAFLVKGMFKEALSALRQVEHPQVWARSGTYNNLAITYEALG